MKRASSCLLLVPSLCLAACSDDGSYPYELAHYGYVVSEASIPTSSAQAAELGMDLDGDGDVDNELGAAFAVLATEGIDVQAAMTAAIDRGDLLLLLDLQTGSFSRQDRAGLQIMLGDPASAMPAPCADPTDAVCRRHLDGTGSFVVAADSPEHLPLVGEISKGTFEGGPASFSLELPLGGSERVQLDLLGARTKMSGLAEAGIDHITLAGGLPDEDFVSLILKAFAPTLRADCPGTTPPGCGCTPGSTGQTLLRLLDRSPQDCVVTLEEITQNPTIFRDPPTLIIDGQRARSFGMKLSAVKALFPLPVAGAAR